MQGAYTGPAETLVELLNTLNTPYMGVSESRGPQYSTLNSRILIVRTQKKVPLIFGTSVSPFKSETPLRACGSRNRIGSGLSSVCGARFARA